MSTANIIGTKHLQGTVGLHRELVPDPANQSDIHGDKSKGHGGTPLPGGGFAFPFFSTELHRRGQWLIDVLAAYRRSLKSPTTTDTPTTFSTSATTTQPMNTTTLAISRPSFIVSPYTTSHTSITFVATAAVVQQSTITDESSLEQWSLSRSSSQPEPTSAVPTQGWAFGKPIQSLTAAASTPAIAVARPLPRSAFSLTPAVAEARPLPRNPFRSVTRTSVKRLGQQRIASWHRPWSIRQWPVPQWPPSHFGNPSAAAHFRKSKQRTHDQQWLPIWSQPNGDPFQNQGAVDRPWATRIVSP